MSIAKILIVDDFRHWHDFLLEVLESEKDFNIIGFASNGEDAVKKAAELEPDIILMDVSMPRMNGFEASNSIRSVSPNSRIVFVSEHRGPELIQTAFDVGGSGYVLKSDINIDLIPGMRAVLEGRQFVSGSLTGWRKDSGPK